ncbi:SsgA family sporulation/cell division regulator [Lentzea sp. E54]|uniref:SsgA family sporulation/cell division regulator n=1 Tax=Lentzea xerophila TaxID=3435883 RepID=UPI003DA2BED4
MPTDLKCSTTFRLVCPDGGHKPVAADLRYSTRDPLAVAVVCHGSGGEVSWTFARDLLAAGLIGPVGEGDVRLRPLSGDGARVLLSLATPFGAIDFVARLLVVADFLDRTFELVADGAEDVVAELDRDIAELVSGAD